MYGIVIGTTYGKLVYGIQVYGILIGWPNVEDAENMRCYLVQYYNYNGAPYYYLMNRYL